MSFELARSLRRLKPQRLATRLQRRAEQDLPFVPAPATPGGELLLDTCVYIDLLQARAPAEVKNLLSLRIVNHSAVALAELTHLFGRLDPGHAQTQSVLQQLSAVVDGIPAHRLSAPSIRAAGEAGIVAGLAARLTERSPGIDLLNDALLLLHAAEKGCRLLTRNVADLDLLQQLVPQSDVLFYRAA